MLPGHEDMDIPVRFGKCCSHPVPGDDIVGFITRGRGVTIHKADCVNVLRGEARTPGARGAGRTATRARASACPSRLSLTTTRTC